MDIKLAFVELEVEAKLGNCHKEKIGYPKNIKINSIIIIQSLHENFPLV